MKELVTALLFMLSPSILLAQWQVRAGGNSLHDGFVNVVGPESPELLWQAPMPGIFGQPVFVEGDIVVTTWLQDGAPQDRGTIVAIQLQTGDTIWTKSLPIDFPSTDWSVYVCAMRDGRVYATRAGNSNSSYLYALDAANGTILWKSQDVTDLYVSEGPAFASNGDLVIGNTNNVSRVNAVSGTRVYQAGRGGSISGGREPVVVGNTYYIRAGTVGDRLSAYDLTNGQFLYWTSSFGSYQSGLFASQDGMLYAPSTNLYAFADTGSGLVQKWWKPLPYSPFSTFAIGPDSSVYSYGLVSDSVVVVRIDHRSGATLDTSQGILAGAVIIPGHIAIDKNGRLFVTNGDVKLYSFNADLSLRWVETIPRSEGGPALAYDGTLLVSGNTGLYAFKAPPTIVPSPTKPGVFVLEGNFPNPFNPLTHIQFHLPSASQVSLKVYDLLGREVRTLTDERLDAGSHRFLFDASGLASGVYFYRLGVRGRYETRKMLLIK